ncbi:unnamed protein product [Closterium sp. NIES-54]
MAITCENSSGDDDDDALYPATEMLEARTGLDFLVSALSHEKEKQAPLTSGAYTGEVSDLSRGDDHFQPAHTAKPAVASAAGPSVRLPSHASSSKPPPRYKQDVLRWADPTAPARPLADAGECRGKHLIIYVTFIRDGAVVTKFFALLTVDKADATSLVGLLLSHVNAVGIDLRRITGISTDGASVMVGSKNGLVARLRTRIPHLVSCHCIAHREALAAKDAAESLLEFGMVDSFIRWLSTYLGSSGPWHQRFLDLQEVFTQTNLELQGINYVRWLSRGDALCRLLAVLPGVIVMVHELGNKPMYQMVTSYRFHFMLRFLADVLEQLNVLSKTFQHLQIDLHAVQGQIRRTTTHINSRYVDCGDDFGGSLSEKLSPFIARHGPNGVRRVEVEWGPMSDAWTSARRWRSPSCITWMSGSQSESLVHNLAESLDKLSGVKLFMPDEWPHGRQERSMVCTEHLESLKTLFKAQECDEIVPGTTCVQSLAYVVYFLVHAHSRTPGVNKKKAFKELRSFRTVLAGAPKSERKFYPGLSAMLRSPDWEDAYPNLVKLWMAVAVLPLSTVECERGFSRQNIIKSWLRGAIKDARLSDLICMALLPYKPDWMEVVKIWRAYKKRKPINTVAAPKKQPSAKGKEKVDEDDAGGAGSGWETETPMHMHVSMSEPASDDDDEDM